MRAVELFAGAGGLGMGISLAGFTPTQVIEWDRWCCDTIRENRKAGIKPVNKWPEPTEGDIRAVDFRTWEEKIDLVSGGPPCQPFSLGGKHRAFDDRRDMWPQAIRAIREIKPKAFIFENVKGLTRASFINYFSYIQLQLKHPEIEKEIDEDWCDHFGRLEQHETSNSLKGLEYKVIAEVLNAANYGVPQKRERVVFVGIRTDLGLAWKFPKASHSLDALLWDQCRDGRYWDRHRVPATERGLDCRMHARAMNLRERPREQPWKTVRDALLNLPDPLEATANDFANHRFQGGARAYPGHTGSFLDEPAKTLKAGVHGVPGGENMLLRPDGTVRYFTVRESARLQTFPDKYQFHGSWTEAMRQLGNAVPVKLGEVLGKGVAELLSKAN